MSLDGENLRERSPVEKLAEKMKLAHKLKIGDVELMLDTGDLDEYHIEKAERELRETPEIVQESLKVLIDMLAGKAFSIFFFIPSLKAMVLILSKIYNHS